MHEWLLMAYKIPPEPSSRRVTIWRRLKGLGAVYIQNGVCILPKNEDHQRQFKIIENEIINLGGEALLLETAGLDRKQEENIIQRFNEERNAEYREFLGKCRDYIAEIDKETADMHFTYAELQENDEDLKKLRNWLERIKKLDYYGAPLLAEAEKQLTICEQVLEEFAHKVYDAEEPMDLKVKTDLKT
jgi:vacuolar-type H+-ATPase subunit I/STV1